MNQIIIKLILLFSLLVSSGCGFKALDNTKISDFKIKEIQTAGDKRINFKIKNNLLMMSSDNDEKIILINLNTKKNKSIKEKNIKNQITKYQISLVSNVKFNLMKNEKINEINVMVSGDYLVANNYSATLNNEKKLIENLTNDLSKKIQEKISLKLNDI